MHSTSLASLAAAIVWILGTRCIAHEAVPPASLRFARPDVEETPDFQRHVVPLLGRLGCNGRACHGSFQGQNGFRLSLFGYDFGMDHEALLTGDEPRVDLEAPEESLILRKPTRQLSHKGGRRMDSGSWQHRLLLKWIEGGATRLGKERRLERLEIQPPEIVFAKPGSATSIRVIARWGDGVAEDVTCLCRFQVGDDSIATVDADGKITAMGKGDTHVVTFYDNGVQSIPVLVPVSDQFGKDYPEVATPTKIDELVVAKLRKLGIVPSEVSSDAEFLRRLSIDLTAGLPTPEEVNAFLADTSADKRQRKIDELLERPSYAAWWANKLCDFTGNRGDRFETVQWYSWIHRRVVENTPYHELAEGIILATGRKPGQTYEEYAVEMSSYLRRESTAPFHERETMPFFWTREGLDKPGDKAMAFGYSFLGLSLQCAQCHKHPFDRWTQRDFNQFSSFFADLKYGVAPESRESFVEIAQKAGFEVKDMKAMGMGGMNPMAGARATLPWRELFLDVEERKNRGHKPESMVSEILGGEGVGLTAVEDPRQALMNWIRRKDNPYFARVFVNRVWANYFHAGIVNPTHDLNLANPPSNKDLLDYLAEAFVEHGYDMKWLHREITRSQTYQRSWRANDTNRLDRRNFSRAVPRRIPAEVVYDALKQTTASRSRQNELRNDPSQRAAGHLSTHMTGTYAMNVFGKPNRRDNTDRERTNEPSLLQSVFLLNDPLVQIRLEASEWLQEVADNPADPGKLIHEAYLRALSRPPTEGDLARAREHVEAAGSLVEGMRDVLWALLNTKEFILNH